MGTPSSGIVTNLTGTASININGTVGATTATTGAFTSISDSGNLTFTGTGNRITGDFNNATIANRVEFQTSNANSNTIVGAIPNGSGAAAGFDFFNNSDTTNASRGRINVAAAAVSVESTITGTGTYLPMIFNTGGSESVRIDTSGNLLVGTTSVIQGGKLSVAGAITSQTAGAGFSANLTTATGDQFYFRTNSGANLAGYITSPTSSTTQYLSISDYRLKDNVVPMSGALGLVLKLKPVTYTWKSDGANGQGFIAHELQAVVPDCVGGTKDAVDAEGNPKYQGIDTSFLVATLTAAIQELKIIVDTQAVKIAALENK